MSLLDKLRKAREARVEVAGFTFVLRRPTDLEMYEMSGNGSPRRLLPYIVDWAGVKEADVVNGGDPHPLPFDAGVCAAWLEDRTDILWPLLGELVGLYNAHRSQQEDAAKN